MLKLLPENENSQNVSFVMQKYRVHVAFTALAIAYSFCESTYRILFNHLLRQSVAVNQQSFIRVRLRIRVRVNTLHFRVSFLNHVSTKFVQKMNMK